MKTSVSVVIPTHGRRELLSRCCEALSKQSLEKNEYEVIVADDEASIETERTINKLRAEFGLLIKYFPVAQTHGPAAARNVGLRQAATDIIAFTDDDTVPDQNWLEEGLNAFNDDVIAAWGRVLVPIGEKPTDYEKNAAAIEYAGFTTANCFCRRWALDVLGGFDERFVTAWREDTDLFFRLMQLSPRVVCVKSAVVRHPVRPAPWGISLIQQRKNQYNVLLFKKHPELYRRFVGARINWRYYLVFLGLVGMGVGILTDQEVIVITSVVWWSFFTGGFLADRLSGTSKKLSHLFEMIVTSVLLPPVALYWRLVGCIRFRTLLP